MTIKPTLESNSCNEYKLVLKISFVLTSKITKRSQRLMCLLDNIRWNKLTINNVDMTVLGMSA